MNPEFAKYIGGGELILFGVIVSLIIIFFKYRVPKVKEDIKQVEILTQTKMSREDCSLVREQCNRLILAKLDKINDHFDLQVANVTEKLNTAIENQEKIQDRFDRFLKLNGS